MRPLVPMMTHVKTKRLIIQLALDLNQTGLMIYGRNIGETLPKFDQYTAQI